MLIDQKDDAMTTILTLVSFHPELKHKGLLNQAIHISSRTGTSRTPTRNAAATLSEDLQAVL